MSGRDRERVLVWAPGGRNAALALDLLRRQGLCADECRSATALVEAIEDAGCALVAQEALTRENLELLEAELGRQPPWSDFPIILLAFKTEAGPARSPWQALGNVTVLERPTQSRTLLAAVSSALRARRRQYEAQQAILHRDQFLAMLGHELRNPLAAITLATEAENVTGRDTAELRRRGQEIIRRQARHLSHLVDDLLDVARVTTGKVLLSRVLLDARDVISRCVQGAEMSARQSSIELRALPATQALPVLADPVRLEEILGNLLSNAIKYSPPGSQIEVCGRAEGGDCVLTVTDHGIGISAELLPRVFDLFTQADDSLDRSRGGLGIGLTIVKSLVELHGGRVSAASPGLGEGSTFSVLLPLAEQRIEVAAPSARPFSSPPLPVSVLVVDDNADLLEMTRAVLETFGCDVASADTGPSGLEQLLSSPPALALIDIGLPGLDGYQIARSAREASLETWMVALTGYGQPEDRDRALAAGFDRHLTKPVSVSDLRRTLEEAGGARLQRRAG